MNAPENLLYTKDHEWARIEGCLATIGITDHAQRALGDITFVELPKTQESATQAARIATVESVKAASDVYAPFSGKIVKVNEALTDSPETINLSPYDKGWFCIIEIKDIAEKNKLMTAKDYAGYINKAV